MSQRPPRKFLCCSTTGSGFAEWYSSFRFIFSHFYLSRAQLSHPGAAFVELYFVLSSLFASRAYYAFGFLALTAGVVALTTATVTILFTYFILCAEEYRYKHMAFSIVAELKFSIDGIGDRSLSVEEAHSG